MTHYDNSGSEDGQLRSPGDTHFLSGSHKNASKSTDDLIDDDTDSLDIKPPQATIRRDSSGKRRSGKEKKHSKERKHKSDHRDREERRERSERSDGGASVGGSYTSGGGGKYREREREMMMDDRRYIKHYDRGRAMTHGQQRREHHYADRGGMIGDEYDYHNRHKHRDMYHHHHQPYQQGAQRYDYHGQRKYMEPPPYDTRPDAEMLEQDLRSRLLSKRHKYVKEYPTSHNHHEKRSNHDYYNREREEAERKKDTVIEVMDSPEQAEYYSSKQQKKKEKHRSPTDPELVARRAKLIEAEREMAKRKEAAREELEARRELRRERGDVEELTSEKPHKSSHKRHHATEEKSLKKKRRKSSKNKSTDGDDVLSESSDVYSHNEDDDDKDDDDDSDASSNEESERKRKKRRISKEDPDNSDVYSHDDDSTSDSSAGSDVQSHKSYNGVSDKTKRKTKHQASDDDAVLPDESPLSIGDLSKSPHKQKSENSRSHSRSEHSSRHSKSRSKTHSDDDDRRSGSHSRSVTRSRSRSRSHSHSVSHSRSGSRSSGSRSRSQSNSRSRSISRSRSGSRSEERNMKKSAEEEAAKGETEVIEEDDVPRNEKGEKLPNYFPGIQGCRSVEEFQCLNRIEEGTYGVVYRAKDKRTNEIVALKRLKMEKEKEGFPITSLREINTLLKGQHPNIVTVREIVVGSNMDRIFIVMDYVEHDLKSLMETMKHKEQSFFPGEVKCLTQQLLCAVAHLHDNWILHRDLKTANLLLSHKGILKVGDFGLAREYGSPLKPYTSIVVTRWYRAPELLLCSPEYSTPIDIWSVGCIFAEFLQMQPIFPGKSEIDQLNRIFKELGTPNEKIWPGYKDLPAVKNMLSQNSQFTEYPVSNLRKRFMRRTTELGISLLQGLLTYDPKQRLTADQALNHAYFKELPLPIDPSMFPTWPAKSELGARKVLAASPKPPSGGAQFKQLGHDEILKTKSSGIISGNKKATAASTGFVLNAGIDQRQLAMGPGFSLKF